MLNTNVDLKQIPATSMNDADFTVETAVDCGMACTEAMNYDLLCVKTITCGYSISFFHTMNLPMANANGQHVVHGPDTTTTKSHKDKTMPRCNNIGSLVNCDDASKIS